MQTRLLSCMIVASGFVGQQETVSTMHERHATLATIGYGWRVAACVHAGVASSFFFITNPARRAWCYVVRIYAFLSTYLYPTLCFGTFVYLHETDESS